MFKNLEETSKTLMCISLFISLVFGLCGIVFINDTAAYLSNPDYQSLIGGRAPFLAGLALGAFLTVIRIILIDRGCKKVLEMDVGMGKLYGTGQYFFRFMLTAGVMLLAMFIPHIGFLGCVLGVLALQIAGYVTPMWEKRKRVDI